MITCTFEKGFSANLRHVVVHALVVKDDSILLVKRAGDLLESGKWSLPGGFVDRDETAPQAVLRELMEETGWSGVVTDLFRVNTNPHRPHEDRQNIALEYLIRPLEKIGVPDHEQSKIEWIPFDKLLPSNQFAFDHGESINLVVKYFREKFPLPVGEAIPV